MSSTVRRALLGGILATALAAPPAHAEEDPWVSDDKALHYGVSAGIAGAGYVAGALLFDERAYALATGAALAAAAGIGKELVDLAGAGHPSWKDLAWDGLGLVTGLALFWGIDLVLRGVSAQHPALAVDRGRIAF